MKRKKIKITACALALALLGTVVGGNLKETEIVAKANDYVVWSAPSTFKVRQDQTDYENKGEAKIELNTVKNEYESSQILISTGGTAVNDYYLQTADLKCGEHTISKENIQVYVEDYIYVGYGEWDGLHGYQSGYYPDALIPIDAYRVKEDMTIKANTNGALWVTVYVPKTAEAGVYTADFTLTVDGTRVNIPVRVTVNDYVLTDEINMWSTFTNRVTTLSAGELDDSQAMYEAYYEFMLDYRIVGRYLPVDGYNAEDTVEMALKYYDETPSYSVQLRDVLPLAAASSTEKNLLSKAFYYLYDEPPLNNEAKLMEMNRDIRAWKKTLETYADMVEADTTGTYDEFKKIENWRSYIVNLRNVVPITNDTFEYAMQNWSGSPDGGTALDEWLSLINVWCPGWRLFDGQSMEYVESVAKNYGAEVWWYTAMGSGTPYGSYQIGETSLLAARTPGWVQQKLDIGGMLYWDAYGYTSETHGLTINQSLNPYVDANRAPALPAGDGNLMYPGAKYDIYGPVPSMRLMAIRDGYEEYEILGDLETRYKEYKQYYGEDFKTEKLLDSLYNAISFDTIKCYVDGENGLDFNAVRTSLIEQVIGGGDESGFVIYDTVIKGNSAEITYYAKADYEVKIGGVLQSPVAGSDVQYRYVLDLTQDSYFRAKITGANYEKDVVEFIADSVLVLNDFESADCVNLVTLSENSEVSLNSDTAWSTDGKSLRLSVASKVSGDKIADARYKPFATVSLGEAKDFTKLKTVNFDVYSVEGQVNMNVLFVSGNGSVQVKTYVLQAGKNTISIPISDITYKNLNAIDAIKLEFKNGASNDVKRVVYIDNMYGAPNKEN